MTSSLESKAPRIVLFGGRFDPPHLGHLQAISDLQWIRPAHAKIIILPTGQSLYKPTQASAFHRLKMAKLAFGHLSNVEVSDLEVSRSGPTFTLDTLRELDRLGLAPKGRCAFVLGSDQASQLPNWKGFPDLLDWAQWWILDRKQDPQTTEQTVCLDFIPLHQRAFIPTQAPALSSTQIRHSIGRTGIPPAGALDANIWDYLKAHRLYGS